MKKSRKILLIMAFVVLLGLIHMPNKAFAAEEQYSSIVIGMNKGMNYNDDVAVELVLGVHESERLKTIVNDTNNNEVTNPNISWKSSDESIVTVDSNGMLTAKGEGTATITATGGGISKSRPVEVSKLQNFIDFSNAKFTWNYTYYGTHLKIENISNKEDISLSYKIIVNNEKTEIREDEHGNIELESNNLHWFPSDYEILLMDQYVEKYTDLSILIVQSVHTRYYNEDGNYISAVNKIEEIKLDEFQFPTFSGSFYAPVISNDITQIILNEPCASTRNFTIKIGKITDESILNKIKIGDKDGFANLEVYAKSNQPIYEGKVTSTYNNKIAYKDGILPLDGKLEPKEYYYLYIILDDENGEYVPIEHCLTLGQASVNSEGNWFVYCYGDDKFNWKEFSTENTGGDYTPTGTDGVISTGKDGTTQTTDKSTSTTILPHTGISYALIVAISIFGVIGIIAYFKNNKYKGI